MCPSLANVMDVAAPALSTTASLDAVAQLRSGSEVQGLTTIRQPVAHAPSFAVVFPAHNITTSAGRLIASLRVYSSAENRSNEAVLMPWLRISCTNDGTAMTSRTPAMVIVTSISMAVNPANFRVDVLTAVYHLLAGVFVPA